MNLFKRLNPEILGDVLAFGAGALLTLAFAPFNLFPLAVLSPALLLGLWLNISPKRAMLRGWLYGVGLFLTGVYWVFISIHRFGNAPIISAAIITAGFIAILGLFPGITGYLLNRYFPETNDAKLICAFPALWVAIEWVRSWFLTGFPWLTLGYSQLNSPLKGYAPIFSVYGISLAVLFTSGLVVNLFFSLREGQRKTFYSSLLAIGVLWAIGGYLTYVPWTEASGKPTQVSLIQGNIPQDVKWTADMVGPTLKRYADLTNEHWDSQIIVWPESAIPISMQDASEFLENISNEAKKNNTSLITGVPVQITGKDTYYNAIIALGKGNGFYLKRRLVPFGEYLPFRTYLSKVLNFMNIPNVTMSDFIPGRNFPVPLNANGIKISSFICYEIAFPEQVRTKNSEINLLLTISNDAWYGRSIAQAQHLQIAQMRALELRRPILFVANDGITAIINPFGQIQDSAPPHQTAVLTGLVQPMVGLTPWQMFGMDPILLIIFFLLSYVGSLRWRTLKYGHIPALQEQRSQA